MAKPLDSRQLLAFATVAQTGSFTRAGKRLHLSQSAMSHSLRSLEEDVGCRLLERSGRTVTLTQAGEHFLRHAERILREMETVRAELGRLGQWGHGRLRLAASVTACEYIVPPVLREFKLSFPQCAITIEPADNALALELLESGRVDLALTLQSQREKNLSFRPLFNDELVFITSSQHAWAKAGRVRREDVGRQYFILYHRQSLTVRLIQRYFAQENLTLPNFMELGSMEAIKELVKLGLGVSILTPWIARRELEDGSLVALPLGKRKLRRQWGIACWKGRRLSLPEETFVGICETVCRNLS